jgi:hypothetical protein
MTRYTVVWVESALNELADIWLAAHDRAIVTAATVQIDRELSEDANNKGVEVREGLRAFFSPPLRILFNVRDADRIAEVLRVKRL